MAVMIAPSARQQFFDNQGNVAAGYKLFTYAALTTTKQSTFTDSTGAVPNANPIILNSAGRTPNGIWLSDNVLYKFVLAPANDTDPPTSPVWTEDNISVLPGTSLIQVVDTIAALKALAAPSSAITYLVRGSSTLGDGFWSLYFWNAADTTADNGSTVLQPNAGGVGRWNILGFLPAGASAVERTLQDKLRDFVNVKDFGALGDGSTDDSAAFAAALAAITTGGTIYIPTGTYRANVTVNKAAVWQGAGMTGTVVRSFSAAGIVFNNTQTGGAWTLQGTWNDMSICGAAGTVTATGIQYGNTIEVNNDEYAGRCEFNRVYFNDLNYCVRKLYGNIGNTFNRCTFGNANFHMHAVSHAAADLMHAGCDHFQDMCHFSGALLAVFYYDSPALGSGQVIVDGSCIIESNPGFVWFVKAFASLDWAPGIICNAAWNEANHTAANVTIDAVVYTPPKFARFTDTRIAAFRNTRLTTIELVASSVVAEQCHYADTFALTKDSDSLFISSEFHADGGSSGFRDMGLVRSISGMERSQGSQVLAVNIPHPKKLSFERVANILHSQSFLDVVTFAGTANIDTTPAADGTLFDKSQDLSYTSAQTELIGIVAPTVGKYLACTLTVKKISGNAPTLRIVNTAAAGVIGSISNTDWRTFGFVTEVTSANDVALLCDPPSAGTTVLRFGGYQLLQFDTRQEAIDYINSGVFCTLVTNAPPYQYPKVSADNGNAAKTLTAGLDLPTQRWATIITADRAVTLSTTGAWNGAKFRIVREATATGAFNINVGTGPLKALATPGSFCDVEYNGSAWMLTAYGVL